MMTILAMPAMAILPFEESFESYPPDSSVTGQHGWQAGSPADAMVTVTAAETDAQAEWSTRTGSSYPLPDANRTRMLQFQNAVSNVFDPVTTQDLWFDILIKPDVWTHAAPPPIAERALCAFYTGPDGRLWAAHTSALDGISTNRWTELTGVERDESGWTRLSVNVVQGPDTAFFSVRVDGGGPVSNMVALAMPSETADHGGSWFPCANMHSRLVPDRLTATGSGLLDDVAIRAVRPSFRVGTTASTALISTLFDPQRGSLNPGSVVEAADGDDVHFSADAAPYFHLGAIRTNGVAFTGHVEEVANTNRYLFHWPDVPAGNHIIEVDFAPDLAHGNTPIWWLAAYYQTNDFNAAAVSDTDGDGMPAWAEYLAGTDPTDPSSIFRILTIDRRGGTNHVLWTGGGSTGLPPFTIYRRTNLLHGTWMPVGIQPRHPSPGNLTHSWQDTAAPPGAFYRIVITP